MKLKAFISVLAGVLLISNVCISQSSNSNSEKFIIVLDIQKHFTEEVLTKENADLLIKNINKVTKDIESKNIIYIQSLLRTLSVSFKGFDVDTVANLELDSRLNIKNDNIIEKKEANAFTVDELNRFLEQNSAKEIIVVGLMAEHCVYETLMGGKEKGYEMYVIPEAIAAKSEKSKDKIIKKLTSKGVHIIHLNRA